MGTQLQAAFEAATTTAATSAKAPEEALRIIQEGVDQHHASLRKERRKRRRKKNRHGMARQYGFAWFTEQFGELEINSTMFPRGEIGRDEGGLIYAPLELDKHRPNKVAIEFNTPIDRPVLFVQGGTVCLIEAGEDIPDLVVPVEWRKKNRDGETVRVPHTRQQDVDNCDIVLFGENGAFMQLQISVKTVSGRWYLTVQDLFCGRVVWTTSADGRGTVIPVGGIEYGIVPMLPENANPEFDYLGRGGNWQAVGRKIVELAAEQFDPLPFDQILDEIPEWCLCDKEALPEIEGWEIGHVLFYNIAWNGGSGFIRCADGETAFVHFNDIVDETGAPIKNAGLPFLPTCFPVYYKRKPNGKGGWKATRVMPGWSDE